MKFYNNPIIGYNPFKSTVLIDEAFLKSRGFSLHWSNKSAWTNGVINVIPRKHGYGYISNWWVNAESSKGIFMISVPSHDVHNMYIKRFLK